MEPIVLHSIFRDEDGSSATMEGDEAAAFKVLPAPIGWVDLHTVPTCSSQRRWELLASL
ncbi:MAG: hypothetical protein JWM59_4481 [Verrucomicrobiales bacterium]|nr:hypothetical protein [Verrucomicrobiales bacterium]